MLAIIVLEDNENERKIIQKMIENRISVNNSLKNMMPRLF